MFKGQEFLKMKNFLIIGLCLSLMGCVCWSEKQVRPFIDLQYGMTKVQVMDLLGKPDQIELYKESDETRVEFYIYVPLDRSSQEKVPVCLIDDKVVGWGKAFYEDRISQDLVRIR